MPDLYGHLTPQGTINGNLQTIVLANNYNDLINKPSINSVELQGNKTAADLGLLTAGDIPVDSVNGQQGVVILDGDDIEYSAGVTVNDQIDTVAAAIPTVPVLSVNSKTGAVVLDGDDIEYEAGTSVNSKITDLEAEIGSGPVVSVNGQQGVVELDGTDINYSLTKTLNQKIDEVAASIPVVSYPVTSVNGETGAVVLDGADIEYSEGVTVNSKIDTVDGKTTTNATAIGSLSTLTTTDKSSLVGAVNEVDGDLDTLSNSFGALSDATDPLVKVKLYSSSSITVPANGAVNVTSNTMNYSIPTGYIPFAVLGWYTSSNDVFARSFEPTATGGSSFCVLRNVSNTAYSGTYQVKIAFIKSAYVNVS